MINLNNPVLVKLPANLLGKDYVVGDLHGCFDELELLLNYVSFDKERDRLFCVGDLIHRGPKSLECLNLLKSRNSKNEKWFFSTLGNHDEVYNDKNAIKYESEDDHINLDKYDIETATKIIREKLDKLQMEKIGHIIQYNMSDIK